MPENSAARGSNWDWDWNTLFDVKTGMALYPFLKGTINWHHIYLRDVVNCVTCTWVLTTASVFVLYWHLHSSQGKTVFEQFLSSVRLCPASLRDTATRGLASFLSLHPEHLVRPPLNQFGHQNLNNNNNNNHNANFGFLPPMDNEPMAFDGANNNNNDDNINNINNNNGINNNNFNFNNGDGNIINNDIDNGAFGMQPNGNGNGNGNGNDIGMGGYFGIPPIEDPFGGQPQLPPAVNGRIAAAESVLHLIVQQV